MIVRCEQRSPEWYALRVGKVTGSRVCDVMAKLIKSKTEAADRRHYRAEIVSEMLTGDWADHYTSEYMEWGAETEKFARAAYEMEVDLPLDEIGFAIHDKIPRFGASPDSLVGDNGLLEIKCLKTENHIDCLLGGIVPLEYRDQMYAEMACSGRDWCDFVSFDPRMPKQLRLFVRRLERDATRIGEIEQGVEKFLAEVDETISRLSGAGEDLTPILEKSLNQVAQFSGIVP